MDKLNYIERLKDALHDTDYKAIKHSEGWITDEEYTEVKAERQAIREEINRIEGMSDSEYYEAYPDEVEEDFNEIPDNDYNELEKPLDGEEGEET